MTANLQGLFAFYVTAWIYVDTRTFAVERACILRFFSIIRENCERIICYYSISLRTTIMRLQA